MKVGGYNKIFKIRYVQIENLSPGQNFPRKVGRNKPSLRIKIKFKYVIFAIAYLPYNFQQFCCNYMFLYFRKLYMFIYLLRCNFCDAEEYVTREM